MIAKYTIGGMRGLPFNRSLLETQFNRVSSVTAWLTLLIHRKRELHAVYPDWVPCLNIREVDDYEETIAHFVFAQSLDPLPLFHVDLSSEEVYGNDHAGFALIKAITHMTVMSVSDDAVYPPNLQGITIRCGNARAIPNLPPTVTDYTHYYNGSIRTLPRLPNLRKLGLKCCFDGFGSRKYAALTELTLMHGCVNVSHLCSLNTLRSLTINLMSPEEQPELLSRLTNLRYLDICAGSGLEFAHLRLPQALETLTLESFHTSDPVHLSIPSSVRKLQIHWCNLVTVKDVRFPPALRELDLSFNKITSLENISLPRLRRLTVDSAVEVGDGFTHCRVTHREND
jgi:hypothetical protein